MKPLKDGTKPKRKAGKTLGMAGGLPGCGPTIDIRPEIATTIIARPLLGCARYLDALPQRVHLFPKRREGRSEAVRCAVKDHERHSSS